MYLASIIGFVAGIFSGMIGIGGGVIMVPAMVMILGYSQHMAQGTALATMMFPVGILAVIQYYKAGYVSFPTVGLLAVGFVIGGFVGGKIAVNIDAMLIKKIFGFVLLFFAVKMIFGK